MPKNKTFNKKKSKNILLFSLVVCFGLALLGGFFLLGRYHKRENARINDPKFLAELIKTELTEENQKIKRGQKVKLPSFFLWHNDTEIYCPSEGRFQKETKGKWLVKPTDLEKKDWDEIVSLIHQNRELSHEKEMTKHKEAIEKLKSSASLQLFYYLDKVPSKGFLKLGERQKHLFWGWDEEKKDTFHLLIPKNHPALIKLSKEQHYLIEGTEKGVSEMIKWLD